MKKTLLQSKLFVSILLVFIYLVGTATNLSAQNLINKAIDKSPSGSSSLLGATTFSLADDNSATTQPNFTIGEIFSFPTGMSTITLNSIYTNGYGSWGTGGTNTAPLYAIVSNPDVLNSGYKSITDGVNRLVVRTPNHSTEMFRFRVEGHKPGENVSVQFTVQEITSNTVSGPTPQLVVNIKEVGGNDYNYHPKLAQGGTLNFSETTARNSGAIEVIVSRDNWNEGANFVYAISNIKVYGTSYLYIDALNSNVCDGDNITLTAKGFDSYIGDYLWESATSISGPFTTILGETQSSISINAPLGNTYYRVSRGTSSVSDVFQLNAKVCCKETSGQRVIFKEEFGTVPSGTRKNFADIGSTGVVPLTYKATENVDDGQYAIVSRNNDAEDFSIGGGHPWYWAGTDHTVNTNGGMLFINCGNNIKNKPVYVRTLDGAQLCNSTYLFFSVYMANPAKTGGNPSLFRLEIWGYNSPSDSTLIESLLTGDIIAGDTQWKQFGTSFLPGTYPELKVKVISLSDAITGNDVIIDDISVTVCAPSIDLEINGNPGLTETSITCGNTTTLNAVALTDLSKLFASAPYYRWEKSVNNGVDWSDTTFSGENITSANLTQNDENNPTIYRVIIAEDAPSAADISNGLGLTDVCATFGITNNIKVSCTPNLSCPTITNNTIQNDQTICNGETPAELTGMLPTVNPVTAYTFQWQSRTGANPFTDIASATNQNYSPNALTETTEYKRLVKIITCSDNESNTITITVQSLPTAGSIGSDQTICNGDTPAFLTNAMSGTGSGAITYKWQSSTTDASSDFADIAGQTGATYAPGALTQTTWFRRITVSTQNSVACESNPTATVQITVQSTPTAGEIGSAQTICNGDTPASLTSTTDGTGSGSITYKWQSSTTDALSGFADIAGQTGATYAPGALIQTTWFRRITVSTQNTVACESSPTSAIQITVNPNPSITTIVSNCTGGILDDVTISATIGSGTLEYSSDNGANYQASNIFTGLTIGTAYTFMVRGVGSTCTVSETFSPSCSCPTVTNNTISTNHDVCSGNVPNELTGLVPTIAPLAPFTYQWQSKPVGSGTFTNVASGGTDSNYTPTALTQSTEFRRQVLIAGCSSFNSNIITVTVNNVPSLTPITAPSAVCSGANLSLTAPSITPNGSAITSQGWEIETAVSSNTFVAFSSPFTVNFADNGKEIRYTATNSCGTTTSNEVVITVHDEPSLSAITAPSAVCSGSNLSLTTPIITPNGAAISTEGWEIETAVSSNTFVAFASPFTVNYTDNGKEIRYTATNACGTTTSNEEIITVHDVPSLTAIATPSAVCSGDNLSLTTPTVTANGTPITNEGWEIETAVSSNTFVAFTSPFTVNFADNGKEIRYTATNSCGTTTSNEEIITVHDVPSLSAITAPSAVCSGADLSLTAPTVTANGTPITTEGWEIETALSSNTFVAFTSPFTVNFADNGKEIRYTATNSCGTTTSNEVVITVSDEPSLSAITAPSAVCSGADLSLTAPTVTANGTPITTEGWEIETALSSNTFVAFTSPFTVDFVDNGKEIRYTATNTCGTTTSNEEIITVHDVPSLTAIATPSAVCSGDNLSLTTPTVTANGTPISTEGWEIETSVGSGIFVAFASPFTVDYTDNGKEIRYTATNACGTTTSNEEIITVHDVPSLTAIATPSAVCSGDNLSLTTPTVTANGTPISTEGWEIETSVGSGIFVAFASPFTVDYTDNGKEIRYTATNACGTTTSNEEIITVHDVPSLTAIATPSAVCSGDNLSLTTPTVTANGTPITNEGWEIETSVGSGIFVAFASPFTVDFADNGKEIRYTATNSCGTTTSNEEIITVHDVPSLTAIATPSAVCSGDNLSLTTPTVTANGTPITTEGWEIETSVGSGIFVAFASPFTVDYTDNGKLIRYTATNACGTTTSNEENIVVYEIPAIISTTPNYTCGDGTVLLEAVASLGTIDWYEDETTSTSLFSGNSYTTPVLSSTTTYYVDATANGCTTASRTAITATVRTIPSITSVTPGERCGEGSVNLSATASAGVINWYETETGGISQSIGTNFATPSIAINTTYYVDATHDNCTTLSRTAVLATVKEIPTITSVTPGERCGEGVVSLSAIPSVGAVNWYDAETGGTLLSTGNTYLTTSLATTTTFYVDATSNSCTSPTRTAVIATIKTAPSVTSVTPNERCGEGAVALAATANNGTLNWFTTDLGGLSIGAGEDFTTPSIVATTNFYVSATHNGCTSDRTPVLATVKPVPVILSTTPAVRCGNGTVRLSASTNMGTINWFASETEGTSLSSGTNFNTPNLSTNTTYYVESSLNGCSSPTRTAVLATIKPMPARPTITITQPDCTTLRGSLTINNHVDGLQYTINGGPLQNLTSFGNLLPGSYIVIAQNALECSSLPSASQTINQTSCLQITKKVNNETPNVSSNVVFTLEVTNNGPSDATNIVVSDMLPDGYIFIQAPPTYNASTGEWNIGNIPANGKSSIQMTARVNYTGDYTNIATIIAGDTNDPNKTDNTASVTTNPIHPLPKANDDIIETNIGTEVSIDVTKNDTFGANYTPKTGSVVSSPPAHGSVSIDDNGTPLDPTDDKIIYTPSNGYFGDDTFEYTITNYHGDTSTALVTVMVTGFTIPDGFSPNGDAINDTFVIQRSSNLTINLIVFNRWGNKVFEQANYANDWEGTGINNQALPEGTYYRIVEAINNTTGQTQKLSGVITLKR